MFDRLRARAARTRCARAQRAIATSVPWAAWGVITEDVDAAAVRSVCDSALVVEALRRLDIPWAPADIRPAVRDALVALAPLEQLRPGWLAHWEVREGGRAHVMGRARTPAERAVRRSLHQEFPASSVLQSWTDLQRAEQAMVAATPFLDRLQRALARHTGVDYEHELNKLRQQD